MAERVEIRGGELDGSVLDNAATEATLLRLVNLMEKSTGTSSGGGASGSNKLQDMYNRSLNASNKGLNNAAKSSSTLGNSFNAATKAISETTGVIGNLLGKTFGAAVSGAAFAVNGLKDFLLSSYTEFRSLSESGASFNNNMVQASQFAMSAGMSLKDFTGLVQKNNTVLTSLGGTATEGAKRLARLSDEIRTGSVGESLYGLGMTTNDINDYLGSYLDQQQRLGSLERKSNKELQEGTRLYAEELDKVSKLTGIERKRLDEQAKKQSLDPVINLLKRGLSPEELAKSTANLSMAAELGGQELQDAIKEIATGVVKSDLARNLQRTGALTRESAQGIVKGQLDAGKVLQNTGRILNERNELNSQEILMGNEALNKTAALRDKLIKLDSADLDRRDKEATQRDALTKAFGRFPAILDNIRNKVFGAFLNSKFFQRTVDFLNRMADSINGFINKINFNKLIDNFLGTIDSAFDSISNVIGPVFTKIKDFFSNILSNIDFDNIRTILSSVFTQVKDMFVKIGESIDFKRIEEVFQSVFKNRIDALTNIFNTVITPLMERASEVLGQVGPKLLPIFEDFAAVTNGLVDFIVSKVIPILAPIGNLILDSINPVVDLIGGTMTVLKGIVMGDFSVVMDGFGKMFQAIGDQIGALTKWFKSTWNAFGKAFKTLGDFFNNIPLYIEKYISDIPVLGSLAQKAGLVRSSKDVDKELEARLEQARKELAAEGTTTPPVASQGTTPNVANQALVSPDFVERQKLLASGMVPPSESRPVASGTQKLTQEESKKPTASNTQSASTPTTAQQKTETDTMIESLKKIDGVLISMAANSPTQEQTKQLNTLIEQLIDISKQQLEANQDLVKATKGAYKPI